MKIIININNYRKQLNENILLFNKFHLSIIYDKVINTP